MKKLLIGVLLFATLFFNIIPNFSPAHAESEWGPVWYDTSIWNLPSWYLKVYDDESTPPSEIFGERYTAAQVQWIMYSLPLATINAFVPRGFVVCAFKITGGDLGGLLTCFDQLEQILNPNAMTPSNKNMAEFFKAQPISAVGYVLSKADNFRLVPVAKAQAGFGYDTAGSMVRDIWTKVRDVAYALFVLVALVMSFMIMFRTKISQQAVISMESSIPKIAISIVLVTFSYAIAGFLIDLMYIAIMFICLIFQTAGMTSLPTVELFNTFINDSILGASFNYFIKMAGTTFAGILDSSGGSSGTGIAAIFAFIVLFHILFKYISIVIMVFKNLAVIIMGIIFAPLEILGGTLSGGGIGAWVRKMVANLALYPLLCVMFFMSFFFLYQAFPKKDTADEKFHNTYGIISLIDYEKTTPWLPPFAHPPSNNYGFVFIITSYALFVSIPKAAEIAMGIVSGKMPNLESAVGEPFNRFIQPASQTGEKRFGEWVMGPGGKIPQALKKTGMGARFVGDVGGDIWRKARTAINTPWTKTRYP